MHKYCFIFPSLAIMLTALVLSYASDIQYSMKKASTAGILVKQQEKTWQQSMHRDMPSGYIADSYVRQTPELTTKHPPIMPEALVAANQKEKIGIEKSDMSYKVANAKKDIQKHLPNVRIKIGKDIHDWYVYLFLKSLEVIPKRHFRNIESLNFENDPKMLYRGFTIASGRGSVKLTMNHPPFPFESIKKCTTVAECLALTKERINMQVFAVMIHELGHIIDLGASLKGSSSSGPSRFKDGSIKINKDDPSVIFYLLCWDRESTLNGKCAGTDFISDYGKEWCFEDLGEAFVAYVLDADNFLKKAAKRSKKGKDVLQQKYDFIKEHMMDGREFLKVPGGATTNSFKSYDSTTRKYPAWDEILWGD